MEADTFLVDGHFIAPQDHQIKFTFLEVTTITELVGFFNVMQSFWTISIHFDHGWA